MKIKKRFLSFVLTITMVFTIFPYSNMDTSASYTGDLQFNANGKFRVMQLADIQDDANVEARTIALITNMIARYNPDLIVFTGDNVGGLNASSFQSSVNQFTQPIINAGVPFAVTFGNHDDEGGVSKQTQYDYYKTRGGDLFVDHDIPSLTGAGSGVIPIFPNDQTNGDPAFQVYLMDSGSYSSSGGYDCPYTDQIDYYIQRSQAYPDVPSLWYMHIIVPDVFYECMTTTPNGTGRTGNGSAFGSRIYYLQASRINWAKSGLATKISDIYQELPCPAKPATYESTAHRSSATYGSKTLYESWVAYGNMLGTYYGHDHKNSFVTTTQHGIDIGFGKAATLQSYNDKNPGSRIYELDVDGTYSTYNVTESDLTKSQVFFDANGGTGEMIPQFIAKNSSAALKANDYTKTGATFLGWATSRAGNVAYANKANYSIGTTDTTLYAQWSGGTVDITFNANGGAGGTGPVPMTPGEVLTPPIVTKTGYTLSWSPPIPATVPSINTTYTAQWTPNTYTINYNGNGSTAGSTASSPHTYDTAKNLTTNGFNRIGYTFLGWSTGSQAGSADYTNEQSIINLTSQPNGVVSFYAVWSANDYLISFDANGGEGGTSNLMKYGAALAAPVVTKTNHTFAGWSPEVPQTVPAQNMIYTAQWNLNSYTITFDANGGTGGTSELMPYGTPLDVPTVAREGYTFLGWSPEVPNEVPANDKVFTALWSVNSYTIIFDANGGEGGTSGAKQYGAVLTPPAVTKTGYSFTGWLPVPTGTVPAENTIYVAQWSAINYTITFDANGGTGGTTTLLAFDSLLAPPVVVRPGFIFTGWTPAVPARVPALSTTYFAQWAVETFTTVFDANGGIGGTSGAYEFGVPLAAPVVTKTGCTFIGWSPAVPSTVPAANATYTAQWSVNLYRITFEAAGGSGSTSSVLAFGALLTPPVVTRYGYDFTGWSPAVSATVPAANTTYTAQWTPGIVAITFDANGGTGGLSAQMAYGSALNAPIVTRIGYEFAGWSPAIPTTVPASNTTYTAQWTPNDAHLIPKLGSTTVVNSDENMIYGLQAGITGEEFERDFVTVTGNARLVITPIVKGFGTGTKVDIVDNETQGIIQTFIVIIFGDVNGDGNIDSIDAAIMVDVENYLITWNPNMVAANFQAGDLNGDGNVDSIDAGIMIGVEDALIIIDQVNGALL